MAQLPAWFEPDNGVNPNSALKEFLDALKGLVKTVVEQLLKAAELMGPEIYEFIVPSDIALLSIDVNAIEVLCQLLSKHAKRLDTVATDGGHNVFSNRGIT